MNVTERKGLRGMPKGQTDKDGREIWGILAEYETPGALIAAARRVRDAGYKKWDCHSPFPVHGIDPAMGIKPTILPWIVFGAGISGTAAAILLQWWTNAHNYAHNISGKPFWSLPANIPIAFELTVLFAAVTCFLAMWGLNLLPELWHPLFGSKRFEKATTDGFFISIEAADPLFDRRASRELLQSAGATHIEECAIDDSSAALPAPLLYVGAIVVTLTLVPLAYFYRARAETTTSGPVHLWFDMDNQIKLKAQKANPIKLYDDAEAPSGLAARLAQFERSLIQNYDRHQEGGTPLFADGRASRLPVEGAVARGELREDEHFYTGKTGGGFAQALPAAVAVTPDLMKRGQQRFDVYCSVCHGVSGRGDGMIARRADRIPDKTNWAPPTNLHTDPVRAQPVGQLFDTITHGIRNMPAYGQQIPEADRWAIILYLKALQRSQRATLEDVPADARATLN